METCDDLYGAVHQRFPAIAHMADANYVRHYGGEDETLTYLWFENLANIVNDGMNGSTHPDFFKDLFCYFANLLDGCSKDVHSCIDVAFVENLFYAVDAGKATPYWAALPKPLQDLYIRFHQRSPLVSHPSPRL